MCHQWNFRCAIVLLCGWLNSCEKHQVGSRPKASLPVAIPAGERSPADFARELGLDPNPPPLSAKDFDAKLDLKLKDGNYVFTVTLKSLTGNFLHVEDPAGGHLAGLEMEYQGGIIRSTSATMISTGGFSGITMSPVDGYVFTITARPDEKGFISRDERDQTLIILEKKAKIRVGMVLRVADYFYGRAAEIELTTNFVEVEFPYQPGVYVPPQEGIPPDVRLPDLPPPHMDTPQPAEPEATPSGK